MNREQLMNVLIAPHVTEKTSLAMQNNNQYTFRVRRNATKTDIKQAVELMFEVKVSGVQVVTEHGAEIIAADLADVGGPPAEAARTRQAGDLPLHAGRRQPGRFVRLQAAAQPAPRSEV